MLLSKSIGVASWSRERAGVDSGRLSQHLTNIESTYDRAWEVLTGQVVEVHFSCVLRVIKRTFVALGPTSLL